MREITNDRYGFGVLGWTAIVVLLGLFILVVPVIIGWAVAYLIHIISGEPEITEFWARWIIGIAVIIVASVFKPEPYFFVSRKVSGGGRDYWFNEYEK